MAYSHCTGMGPGQVQVPGSAQQETMGSHSFPCHGAVSVQCSLLTHTAYAPVSTYRLRFRQSLSLWQQHPLCILTETDTGTVCVNRPLRTVNLVSSLNNFYNIQHTNICLHHQLVVTTKICGFAKEVPLFSQNRWIGRLNGNFTCSYWPFASNDCHSQRGRERIMYTTLAYII